MLYKNLLNNKEIDVRSKAGVVSACLLSATSAAFANPTGGQVTSGSATIDYGSTTTITQSTNKAIINWEGFSIGPDEVTQFKQPSSSSVTLNRVVGSDLSHLQGRLSANGQIILVNPNGIVFGPNAVVDVAGLVASTANISDQDFLAGNLNFVDAPDGSAVINYGEISVRDAGMAVLVAPTVENYGVINANMGSVVLHSGKQFTVDLYGDGLITFDADVLVEKGYVSNSGEIHANGGTVMMSVAAADEVLESLINMDGYIEATTVANQRGEVLVLGNENSHIKIAGEINASGNDIGEVGGVIQASADYVQLLHTASLDVSGDTGGGQVHIGSDAQLGQSETLRTADYVYMADGANINADALVAGDGGEVLLWANNYTWFYGDISARGGMLSGDGGLVETSGYLYLDVAGGMVDAGATYGSAGNWLLDPINITITDSDATAAGTFSGNDSLFTFTPTASGAQISATTLSNTLAGGTDVTITTTGTLDPDQEGNVTFTNSTTPVAWGTSNTFSVYAHNNIIFSVGSNDAINAAGDGATGTGKTVLRVDYDGDGNGAFIFSGTANIVHANGDVDLIYNPTNFGVIDNFSSHVSREGEVATGLMREFMLIQNLKNLDNLEATDPENRSFQYLAANSGLWSMNFALAKDLNEGGATFNLANPIGSFPAAPFSGIFDGQGHTIYNVRYANEVGAAYVGLFGFVIGGIRDINLDNVVVTTNGQGAGILLGVIADGTLIGGSSVPGAGIYGDITVSNSSVVSTYTASTALVGGIMGGAGGVPINASLVGNNNIVTAAHNTVGGLIGILNFGATLDGSLTSNAVVTGVDYVAGLIAGLDTATLASTLTMLTTGGSVTGEDYVGGLIASLPAAGANGANNFAVSTDMVNNADVTATGNYVGGIIGQWGEATKTTFNQDITNNGDVVADNATITGVGGITALLNGTFTFGGTLTNTGDIGSATSGISVPVAGLFATLSGQTFTTTAVLQNLGGTIRGAADVAGIATTVNGGLAPTVFAMNDGDSSTFELLNTGNVITTAGKSAAGIFGIWTAGGLTYNFDMKNTGNVTGSNTTYVAGLVGFHEFDSKNALGSTFNGNLINTGNITAAYASLGGGGAPGGEIGGRGGDAPDAAASSFAGGLFGALGKSTGTKGGEPTTININGLLSNSGTITAGTGAATDMETTGGLIGITELTSFGQSSQLANTGNVTGGLRTGGLFGTVGLTSTFHSSNQPSTNTGNIMGYIDPNHSLATSGGTGGLIGFWQSPGNEIFRVSNTGNVTSTGTVGGIIGILVGSKINLAYVGADATIKGGSNGNSFIGGIAGGVANHVVRDIGGDVTYYGTVSDALFNGTVGLQNPALTTNALGGIAGLSYGTLRNTVMVGTVDPVNSTYAGALVGVNGFNPGTGLEIGTIIFAGYDNVVNPGLAPVGLYPNGIYLGTSGALAGRASTYAGFNFTGENPKWTIDPSGNKYAALSWCASSGCAIPIKSFTTAAETTTSGTTLTPRQNTELTIATTDIARTNPYQKAQQPNLFRTIAKNASGVIKYEPTNITRSVEVITPNSINWEAVSPGGVAVIQQSVVFEFDQDFVSGNVKVGGDNWNYRNEYED